MQLQVYLRSYALEQMVQAASSSAGLRIIKRVEQTLQDLGVCIYSLDCIKCGFFHLLTRKISVRNSLMGFLYLLHYKASPLKYSLQLKTSSAFMNIIFKHWGTKGIDWRLSAFANIILKLWEPRA